MKVMEMYSNIVAHQAITQAAQMTIQAVLVVLVAQVTLTLVVVEIVAVVALEGVGNE